MTLVIPMGDERECRPCPANVPERAPAKREVLVAWDGSTATIAALQSFVGEWAGHHFILAEVGPVRPSAGDAAAWLNAHGATAQVQRLPRVEPSGAALRKVCSVMRLSHCLTADLCRGAASTA